MSLALRSWLIVMPTYFCSADQSFIGDDVQFPECVKEVLGILGSFVLNAKVIDHKGEDDATALMFK